MMVEQKATNENLGPMEGVTGNDSSKQNNAMDALVDLQESYGYYGIDYIKDNFKTVFSMIVDGLQDSSWNSRRIALEIAAEAIPCFVNTEEALEMITQDIIPKCVLNLCHSNSAIKKLTVQTLHVYMKCYGRVQDVLKVIIQKLEDKDAKVRTELMVALPVVITPAFAEGDIFELISALVHRLELSSVKTEHNPPSLVCLGRIKSVLGETSFMTYIDRLPDRLQKEYKSSVQNSKISHGKVDIDRQISSHSMSVKSSSNASLHPTGSAEESLGGNSNGSLKLSKQFSKSSSSLDKNSVKPVNSAEKIGLIRARSTEKVTKAKTSSERLKKLELFNGANNGELGKQTLHYGFIPSSTMAELGESSWKTRAHGIDELKIIVEGIDDSSLITNLSDFLEMLTRFAYDPNFKILLTSLQILRDVLEKVGEDIRPNLELVLTVVQAKLGDSKTIIKQLNNQIVLKMMKFAKPWMVLNSLTPALAHRNSKVREDVVNIITAALLTFPSSDFKLIALPSLISNLLIDPKRRVRQAVLECFAVISQALGPGRMQPLVASVDMIELSADGEGVMEAVQARLARRRLPKLTTEGTLEYSMPIPAAAKNHMPMPPDVSWILYGSPAGQNDHSKTNGDNSPKRYCSAGKKRLPWENSDNLENSPFRKSLGSAPLRSHEDRETDKQPQFVTRNSWAPGQNTSHVEKYQVKERLETMPMKQENLDFAKNDSSGSYFRMYKQRMRKLKQAGLQADNNMINTLSRTSPLSAIDSLHSKRQVVRRNSIGKESMYTPSPLSPVRATDTSPVPPFEDKQLSASWSGAELNDNQMWQLAKKPTDLEPLGNGSENGVYRDIESPVHLKAAIAKSASKKRRQSQGEAGKVSPTKLEDNDEQEKTNKPIPDPLANIRQQAAILKQQKQEEEVRTSVYSSPFDSRPRIARSPSARKSKTRIRVSENMSSDTSDSLSPRETRPESDNGRKLSPAREKVLVAEDHSELTSKFSDLQLRNGKAGIEAGLNGADAVAAAEISEEVVQPDVSRISRSESSGDWKKSNSGLSKSALERVEKRRGEEIRKRELAIIRMREREVEERLRAEKEAQEAEERKQAQLEQTMAEMKRLEELIKAEERKKEEELLEKKRLEDEARRKEELTLKREQQARIDEDEMRKAEEQMRKKEMGRREERMKELEDMIKIEEKRQGDIRKMKEDMKREEEVRQFRREEELRKQEEEELKFQIEEEKRKKAEAELKEARRKKAELRRIKEQQVMQELEAKEKEEEERRVKLKMMADSIELQNQQDQHAQLEAFEVNFGSCDRKNQYLGHGPGDDANNNYTKPAASHSPKARRKLINNGRDGRALSGSHVSDQVGSANAVKRSSTEGDILHEQLHPYNNPDQALKDALRNVAANSEDWEIKCDGLHAFRRLSLHHPDVLAAQMHTISLAITTEVRNLRSQVARSAITCLGDILMHLPKPMEPELDLAVNALLGKAGESNTFIKQDVEQSLSSILNYVNPVKAMGAFINRGAGHKNGQVRKMCARFLSRLAEKMGDARLLSGSKDVTERILPVAAQFAVDGQQETRYYGRCILYLMINHPDLDKLMEKHLPKANLRPAKDVVDNIRAKGPGDPPGEHGSAALRRSTRHTGSGVSRTAEVRSSTLSGKRNNSDVSQGNGAKPSVRSSTKRTTRQASQPDGYQPARQLDLESLAGLTANDWKTRSEAIENLYDLVRTNPERVEGHISKVFDKFIPRLTDSNSKVHLQALQTMNKIIPILRDSLAPLITMLMQSLTSCVASKNNSIYNASMEVLVSLTKFVDNVLLLQPLISAVRYGNARVKPEMAMRLADLVTPVFQRKQSLVQSHIFPVLWHLLSNSKGGSAANSRNDINTATAKLCEELYICYGESLYDEAANQGKEMSEKLRYYMM